MITYHHNIHDLASALDDLSSGIRNTVITRSLNEAINRKTKSLSKKAVRQRGNFQAAKYVNDKMSVMHASAANPVATLRANQKHYSLINNFSKAKMELGGKVKASKPWGVSRTYSNAFYVGSKYGSHLVPVIRRDGKLHALYGPAVPRELEREMEREQPVGPDILQETARYAQVRIAHHLDQVAKASKTKYRL